MLSILTWLTGSKPGRYAAAILLAIAAVILLLLQVRRSGVDAEKVRQAQASLTALRTRISTDDEITKMSPDARRAELARWMQRSDDGE